MTTVKDAMGGTSGPGLSGRVLWTHRTPRFLVFVRSGCESESFYLFMRKLFIGFRRRPQDGREDRLSQLLMFPIMATEADTHTGIAR